MNEYNIQLDKELKIAYYDNIIEYVNKNKMHSVVQINNIIKLREELTFCKNTDINPSSESLSASQVTEHNNGEEIYYKKPWVKLNVVHKIIKIKEFVNELKINLEEDREKLRGELIELIKNKTLTKKDKIKYDETNMKIVSIVDLEYNNGKYEYIKK